MNARFLVPTLCAALGLSCLVAASPGQAAVKATGGSTLFTWAGSTGPVAGYWVFVYRNGAAVPDLPVVSTNPTRRIVEVRGTPGDTIRIQVAAFDAEGNVGPASKLSQKIVFSGPRSSIPRDDETGWTTADLPKRPRPRCAEPVLALGADKIRVRGTLREKGAAGMHSVLCNGAWSGFTAGNLHWVGQFERVGRKGSKARKLRVHPDAGTIERLLRSLARRIERSGGGSWTLALRRDPKLRVKTNSKRDRVKWELDLKLELTDSATGKVRRGRYRFELLGSLTPALARSIWP